MTREAPDEEVMGMDVDRGEEMPGKPILMGQRYEIDANSNAFPEALKRIPEPPSKLFIVGNPQALQEGLAVVGARKATPYGRSCARRFASRAAQRDVVVVSGGARGCDGEAHKGALEAGGLTVVFLGGGCDEVYPLQHFQLFQRIIDAGGAVVSEQPWSAPPLPYMFRQRNRLIAGLSKATLIVEAGLPSGTFSTADAALESGKEVLAVPGAITSRNSAGSNRLIAQGAIPIIDDESFDDALFGVFGIMKVMRIAKEGRNASDVCSAGNKEREDMGNDEFVAAILAEPLDETQLYDIAVSLCNGQAPIPWMSERLLRAERAGLIMRYPDGRYGAIK